MSDTEMVRVDKRQSSLLLKLSLFTAWQDEDAKRWRSAAEHYRLAEKFARHYGQQDLARELDISAARCEVAPG